jgi:tellurite resistance protein
VKRKKEEKERLAIGIEYPERRFGVIAMEKGFINADQLWEALVAQKAQVTGDAERRHVGMILKDLGYLSMFQINQVLQTMKAEMESRKAVSKVPRRKTRKAKPK